MNKRNVVRLLLLPILFFIGVVTFGTEQAEATSLTSTWSTNTASDPLAQNDPIFGRSANQTVPSSFNARCYIPPTYGGVQVVKYDSKTNARLAGAQFTIYNSRNQAVQVIQTNTNGIAETRTLANGNYSIRETKAPDGYQLDSSLLRFSVCAGKMVCLSKCNVPLPVKKGCIKVTKINENRQVLNGAVFDVYNSNDQFIGKITTSGNGTATLGNLPYGTYKLVEAKAPEGYELDTTPKYVTLSASSPCGVASITICNKKKVCTGKIKVVKRDECGKNVLAGAEFDIFNSKNQLVGKITTDKNGVAELANLPYGTYKLVETKAPEGYELDATPKYVTLSQWSNGVACITICNKKTPTGKIRVVKRDECGKNVLAGAEFDVFDSNNKLVGKITTDKNGVAELANLPYGTYKLVETKAPEGYELDATPKYVTLSKYSNGIACITICNKKTPTGKIKVVKKDEANQLLAGAEFIVIDSNNQLVEKITTDKNGVAELTNLPYGTYKVIEAKAPEGYELDATPKYITLSKNSPSGIATLTILNKKKVEKGSIEVIKKDEVGQLLAGAEFNVLDSEDKVVGTIITGVNGGGSLGNLPYGTYRLVETKAPEGYELDPTPRTVTISKTNQVVKIEVVNKKTAPVTGGIKIIKFVKGSNPEVYLKDAVFEIYDKDNKIVGSYTTNEQGEALVSDLEAGKYLVLEVKAPPGYQEDITIYEVIVEAGKIVEVRHPNVEKITTGDLLVKKYVRDRAGFETTIPVPDAKFEVIDSAGKTYTGTTDNEGNIHFSGLPAGEVTITETEAPTGFIKDSTPQTKTIEVGKTTEAIFYNEIKPRSGLLNIYLSSSNSETSLANIEYQIVSSENDKVIDTIKTNEFGQASVALPVGEYKLVPTISFLDEQAQTFKVEEGKLTIIHLEI
ncbi:SpaA isopeptide-forming pilin-related protein [Enterococcus sp. LJL99]